MSEGQAKRSPREILDYIAAMYGITVAQIRSRRRDTHIVRARHHAVHLIKHEHEAFSSCRIGRLVNKDHSTVLNIMARPCPDMADAMKRCRVRRKPVDGEEAIRIMPRSLVAHDHPPSKLAKLCVPAAPGIWEGLRALVQMEGYQCFVKHNEPNPAL